MDSLEDATEDLFFNRPVKVARANIASNAMPSDTLAPFVTPAPTATRIESLISTLIRRAGAKILQWVRLMPICLLYTSDAADE